MHKRGRLLHSNNHSGDNPGTLQFSASGYSVADNAGTVLITVTRAGGRRGTVTVGYGTSNGTAIAPGDYATTSGTLTWTDGDTANKTFTVAIVNDLDVGSETFTVTLSNPGGGASLGTPSSATVTITPSV